MIISNATPLIYLSRINKLGLLKVIFGKVFIPLEVEKEVIVKGKKLNKPAVYLIEKAIFDGWISVERVRTIVKSPIKLDRGEQEVLSLTIQKKQKQVLIDEISARTAAKILGLKPCGTVFVLLKALKKGLLSFDDFLEAMSRLASEGFRLREEIYLRVIRKAKALASK